MNEHNQPRFAFRPPPMSPTVKWLMIALGVIFVAQLIVHGAVRFDGARYAALVDEPLALYNDRLARGQVWRAFTYMFLHQPTGFAHLAFNLLTLYFFGPSLEERFGRARFLTTFVSCGVAGAILSTLVFSVAALAGATGQSPAIIGASGAVSGLVGALCWLWRSRKINMIFFEATGLQLLGVFVALDVLRLLMGSPVAVFVHLGGTGMGVLIASGIGPYAALQRVRLWRARRRLRVVSGGKDAQDYLH